MTEIGSFYCITKFSVMRFTVKYVLLAGIITATPISRNKNISDVLLAKKIE